MDRDTKAQLQDLKREYLELERIRGEEKACLLRLAHVLGAALARDEELARGFREIQGLLSPDKTLPVDVIEKALAGLKQRIMAREAATEDPHRAELERLRSRLLETIRTLKRVMALLLDDFYPLTQGLDEKARAVDLGSLDRDDADLGPAANAFLGYVRDLKDKILEDSRSVQKVFLTLLEHVKELEKTLRSEVAGEEQLREIEYFEMRISTETGSILESFDVQRTLDEVKATVIEKISNIKRLVSLKKEEETRRLHSAQERMDRLSKRITEAEQDAKEMSRKAERLEIQAMKDGLTGVYNRRAFDIKVRETLAAFAETGNPFSIVLFDVDGFKTINDTFGHLAGDKVLQKVAQSLRETFRKEDFIARYGGDEFVVVIEQLTKEMARDKILTFRKNLRKRRFTSYAKGDISVNVSAGIALAKEGDTLEGLIERADKAMYALKRKQG